MALHYEHIGFNEDGSPRFHIHSDNPDAHIVMTGPIVGPVIVDGAPIDVSAPFIEVDTPEKALAVSDAIGARHVVELHPDFVSDPEKDSAGFVHVASDGTAYANAAISDAALSEAADALHIDPETIVKVEA